MDKHYYVYILTNARSTVLYKGITNDLVRRIHEHKEKTVEGFTKKYNLDKLVYFEVFEDVVAAIAREKQIKAGSRKKKIALIERVNSEWADLYESILGR